MLKDYVGKKVRVIVSSGSGASVISGGERFSNGVMSNVMNFYGFISSYDDKFLELKDVKFSLYNLDTEKPMGLNYPISIDSQVFENDKALINLNSIISIVLI